MSCFKLGAFAAAQQYNGAREKTAPENLRGWN